MRRAALAFFLGVALAAAPVEAQTPMIACSRNFTIGDMQGLIEQIQGPDGAGGPIRFSLWGRGAVRLDWWDIRQDAPSLEPPGSLSWDFELAVSDRQALWARYWADGVPIGRVLYLPVSALRPTGGLRLHSLWLNHPAILRRLLAAEVREVEIVGEDGISLMRRRLPAASPGALRAGFADQIAWLAEARRNRSQPACYELPNPDQEI